LRQGGVTDAAYAILVAAILGLTGWLARTHRELGRMRSALRGERADRITGDIGRPPLGQRLLDLETWRAGVDRQLVELGQVAAELRPNGGRSLADAIRRIDRHLTGGSS
jgi:hypothetical protein